MKVRKQIDIQNVITAIVVGSIMALIVASLLISYLATAFSRWPAA
jgi:hypothetical protein